MESIREILRIGPGPSSSHTMGPKKAAEVFQARYPAAHAYRVTLYGSLAATGRGHQTDQAIRSALAPTEVRFDWQPDTVLLRHPNAMKFEALGPASETLGEWTVYSIGGGKITDFETESEPASLYEFTTTETILAWQGRTGKSFWEYVVETEGDEIYEHLATVWQVMSDAIARGLEQEGVIPGGLRLSRKAASYFAKAKSLQGVLRIRAHIFAYALAVAEENATGGEIVTAPTCGASGVLPAVLKLLSDEQKFSVKKILRALATAGLVGNLVKKNASISGAEVGCQGEIGTACAMASAAAAQLLGGTPAQIEYAAEMGLEHHLGLTCDPIAGLVQIPCIERNAVAAGRALDNAAYALLSDGQHIVSFDKIIRTMNQTGHDLPRIYRETSAGGMAILDQD